MVSPMPKRPPKLCLSTAGPAPDSARTPYTTVMTLLEAHLDQISRCAQSIAELPYVLRSIVVNVL